jgi:hypothetical protein
VTPVELGCVQSLDGKHTLFGEVAEDEDGVVARLNAAIVDDDARPLQNIRIRRTTVLDDPFPDPKGLDAVIPEQSPEPLYEYTDRIEEDWKPKEDTRCCLLCFTHCNWHCVHTLVCLGAYGYTQLAVSMQIYHRQLLLLAM